VHGQYNIDECRRRKRKHIVEKECDTNKVFLEQGLPLSLKNGQRQENLLFFKRKEEELHNHIPLKVFWISLGNSLEYLIGLHFIYCPYHYFFS
jgi:hypothetical protein